MKPRCWYWLDCNKLLVCGAYNQKSMPQTVPRRLQAIILQGTGNFFKSLTQQPRGTCASSSTNFMPTTKSCQFSRHLLWFYQFKLSPPWITMWGLSALSRLGKIKQPWTLSWFHGPLLYRDLLFSSASHFQGSQPPSYPPKLPSPNNRLKAIQLSPLYSMHFIFSLPCTSSLTTPAIGSEGWRREAVEGWVGWGDFLGVP